MQKDLAQDQKNNAGIPSASCLLTSNLLHPASPVTFRTINDSMHNNILYI